MTALTVGTVHASRAGGLNIISILTNIREYISAYLDTRSVSQATLELHHSTADFVTHAGLPAMVDWRRRGVAVVGGVRVCSVVVGSKRSASTMTVMAQTVGMGGGLLGASVCASDRVGRLARGDFGVMVAVSETGHDAATRGRSCGGACASHY